MPQGKEALLLWCKEVANPYPGVNITNFTKSWQDGLGFCAIISAYRPDLIDFSTLKKENGQANLEKAFRSAESIGIPALLDAEDIVLYPEQLSIITYLSQYYHKFRGQEPKGVANSLSQRPPVVSHPSADKIRRKSMALSKEKMKENEKILKSIRSDPKTHSPRQNCSKCARPLLEGEVVSIESIGLEYHKSCFLSLSCQTCGNKVGREPAFVNGKICCSSCTKAATLPPPQASGKACVKCSKPVIGKFCSSCGASQPAEQQPQAPNVCVKCSKPVVGKFCSSCGTRVAAPPLPAKDNPQEKEKKENEQRLEREKKDREKREKEERERKQKEENERKERERKQKEENERTEREKKQREENEKKERDRREKEEMERKQREREQREREEKERREKEEKERRERRLERERKEKERQEKERLERQKLEEERQRMQKDREEREKREREKNEREEKARKERQEREKEEKEREEKERLETERLQREKEKIDQELKMLQDEQDRYEKEKLLKEQQEKKEQLERQLEKEKEERKKNQIEKELIQRQEQEQQEQERLIKEQVEKEEREFEKREREALERLEQLRKEKEELKNTPTSTPTKSGLTSTPTKSGLTSTPTKSGLTSTPTKSGLVSKTTSTTPAKPHWRESLARQEQEKREREAQIQMEKEKKIQDLIKNQGKDLPRTAKERRHSRSTIRPIEGQSKSFVVTDESGKQSPIQVTRQHASSVQKEPQEVAIVRKSFRLSKKPEAKSLHTQLAEFQTESSSPDWRDSLRETKTRTQQEAIRLEGWLYKKKDTVGFIDWWAYRWFSVQEDSLVYWKYQPKKNSNNIQKPDGIISLRSVENVVPVPGKKPHMFALKTKAGLSYEFQANSEWEELQWIAGLIQIVTFLAVEEQELEVLKQEAKKKNVSYIDLIPKDQSPSVQTHSVAEPAKDKEGPLQWKFKGGTFKSGYALLRGGVLYLFNAKGEKPIKKTPLFQAKLEEYKPDKYEYAFEVTTAKDTILLSTQNDMFLFHEWLNAILAHRLAIEEMVKCITF